jgi:hypothetical protein
MDVPLRDETFSDTTKRYEESSLARCAVVAQGKARQGKQHYIMWIDKQIVLALAFTYVAQATTTIALHPSHVRGRTSHRRDCMEAQPNGWVAPYCSVVQYQMTDCLVEGRAQHTS